MHTLHDNMYQVRYFPPHHLAKIGISLRHTVVGRNPLTKVSFTVSARSQLYFWILVPINFSARILYTAKHPFHMYGLPEKTSSYFCSCMFLVTPDLPQLRVDACAKNKGRTDHQPKKRLEKQRREWRQDNTTPSMSEITQGGKNATATPTEALYMITAAV